ncbi:hypothetical protein O3M35_002169 [Rhynocoris fuscipes]|uniref:Major facilitator superfamily (MFS) profile domain-containing protein n=1 Tax=Rhynocoris fuscipes TaxID=488301 RepID=A0AAW1CRK4_9HEMI
MISQILGLNSILGTEDKWPHLFFITFIPALLQLVMLPLCPESPKQVLKVTHNELKAKQVLVWLRGSLDVHAELEEMKDELEAERSEAKASLRELLTNRSLRIPLIISCMLMIAQQLSGINIVTYYSTKIFHQAQLSNDAAQYATLAVGIMNVLATLVSLALVEKSGRKTLLIIGFGGMFFSTVLLTFCLANVEMIFVTYLSIGAVLLFVIFFSMGPGSIPWFITTELFNHNARPTATSVAVSINWASNFLVGIGFLPLAALWDYYVFLLFAAIQAVFVIFIYKKVPETRNKTTEEISALFR